MDTAEKTAKDLRGQIGKTVQAIRTDEDYPMTMLAVVKFTDDDGGLVMTVNPDPYKDFHVNVKSIEGQDSNRWVIEGGGHTWVLQKPPVEAVAKRWATQMRKMGYSA